MSSRLELRDYPMLLLAAEILRGGGTVHVKAWGNSMLPTLWPGDLLTIQRAAFEELIAGDIVLVLRNGRFFIHRFVEKQEVQDRLSVVTRGDGMPDSDPPASAPQLLGRVAVVRRAERISFRLAESRRFIRLWRGSCVTATESARSLAHA